MNVLTQLIHELRQTANGAAVLNDWLGEGGMPVPQAQAEERSAACLYGTKTGEPCPKNRAPRWWEKMLKDPIAATIRKQIELKNSIGLTLSKEDDLHMCSTCGCCLPLKLHVPIEHIKRHHQPEHHYPPHCWVLKEMSQSTNKQTGAL